MLRSNKVWLKPCEYEPTAANHRMSDDGSVTQESDVSTRQMFTCTTCGLHFHSPNERDEHQAKEHQIKVFGKTKNFYGKESL